MSTIAGKCRCGLSAGTVRRIRPPVQTRFKICCIQTPEEARLAIEAGASALGLVSAMPSGPGEIPDALIAEIAKEVPPMVETFLLTPLQEPDAIVDHHRAAPTTTLQLVARLSGPVGLRLREVLPGVRLVQVVQVEGDAALETAAAAAEWAHAVLLDSGVEAEGRLGGTGRLHDWRISEAIRERLDIPVILAGGLTPDNVAGAITTVAPFAVDVCTGVRDDRFALDPGLLKRFSAAVAGL